MTDWGLLAATGENGRFEAALAGTPPEPHNPITYADRIHTPVLVLHGRDDTNVPISQADTFVAALDGFGVVHEYVRYPRENHSFRERDHQLDVLRRSRAWFDRWLA